jgi:hypothetical protein
MSRRATRMNGAAPYRSADPIPVRLPALDPSELATLASASRSRTLSQSPGLLGMTVAMCVMGWHAPLGSMAASVAMLAGLIFGERERFLRLSPQVQAMCEAHGVVRRTLEPRHKPLWRLYEAMRNAEAR